MDTYEIIDAIDAEIGRLEQIRNLLGKSTDKAPRRDGSKAIRKRRRMSAEGRANIIAAQKARWAKSRK